MIHTEKLAAASEQLAFLTGGGEMGERTRALDWSQTPLGPVAEWPTSLKAAVSICLGSRYPIVMWWGRQALTQFYNDAYIPILGSTKHPGWLGRSGRECWSDVWMTVGPMLEGVLATGEATWSEDMLLVMHRNLPREENYFTFSYSPIRDDFGAVGGIFCAVTETTSRVIGERRLRTLRDLGRTATGAKSAQEACEVTARTLAANPADIPFALIYLLDGDGRHARLVAATGLRAGSAPAPDRIDLSESSTWPLHPAFDSDAGETVSDLRVRFGSLPGGLWPESPEQALVLPIATPGQSRPTGFLIAGLSPRRVVDADYRSFFDLIAGHVSTAIANARAYEQEKRRAEALAEIDRAKTAFFSNVSHEFRTPLSLILGPVEDTLAEANGQLPSLYRERLEVVHRNGLRLQRLVNTLLDFSRIEAGRVRATYEPTDLAAMTTELASNFRSACEKAGLELLVDCPPLGEPVFVDREMWEKIVLNLLSNAFKFTLEGGITISLRQTGQSAELRVQDTGTGIPAEEMPRLFERFHRVENAQGRTHEGSGIGLALVQELVHLHGGAILAESQVSAGTTFTVSIPLGTAHLPTDRINRHSSLDKATTGAAPFVQEALRWLPEEGRGARDEGREGIRTTAEGREGIGTTAEGRENGSPSSLASNPSPLITPLAPRSSPLISPLASNPSPVISPLATRHSPLILVAEDNADMRQYVVRLLADRHEVEAFPDGEAALAAARKRTPDLILTDIMMPRLDGFGLLRELRADPRTRSVPVVMLSARAGEESRVEGIEAGADDYLVKPFSTREFLARVASHLEMARMRREWGESLRQSEERYRVLFETMSEGFSMNELIFDEAGRCCDLRYLEMNPAFERHTGLKRADTVGRTTLELFPDSDPRWFESYGEIVTSGVPAHFQVNFGPLGRWFDISAYKTGPNQCATVFFDVTERIEAEANLRASEERFRTLFESMEEAFCVVEMLYDAENRPADYRFLEANPTFEKHTGFKDAVGRRIRELVPDHDAHWFEIFGRVAATGEATRFIDEAKAMGRWYDVYAYRVGAPDSRKVGILFTDITARKRDEEKNLELLKELETQNAFVKAVLSQVPAAIVVADAGTGQIRMSNEEAHRIVRHEYHNGKRLEDYGNIYIREAYATDGTRYVSGQWPLDRAIRGETVVAEEIELFLSDGARVIVRVNAGPIRVGENVVAAVVAFHDITDRKIAERSARFLADASAALAGLVDYENTLQRVAHLAVPGFADWAVVDMAGETGSARRLVVAHADPSKAELAKSLQHRLAHGDSAASEPVKILRSGLPVLHTTFTDEMLVAAATDEDDLRLLRELGLNSYIGVPLNIQGETVGVLSFLSAQSGRRYSEYDLAVAKDLASRASIAIENSQLYARLRDADRRKNEFLATLAHELRNPLAPIRNGLQVMKLSGKAGASVEECRSMMERQLGQMVRLVDDLMDVSRINQGKLELRKERVQLAAVVQSAIETSRPLIEAMGHALEVHLPKQPVVVEADLTRLSQALLNLLNNAAKYTECGGHIWLTAERQGSDVVVSVRDNGIGIARDQLPHIFEMFTQTDRAMERSQGGLGIGLSLVKRLVEMHGGRIEARSDGPGKGAEFVVRLPVAIEASIPSTGVVKGEAAEKTALRVLIVDDNRDGADSLSMMLKIMGNDTRTAYDGEEAVAATVEFLPDVILLDIGLPKLTGYEACRLIRQQPRGKELVIIAQTGWGQEEDRQRTHDAGFDHHMVKPVDPHALIKLLAGLQAANY